jgi:hypothetical protein
LFLALQQIAHACCEQVAHWSDAELKQAGCICDNAAVFFNQRLKQRTKNPSPPPKIRLRR